MSNKITIETVFGTLDDNQINTLTNGVNEILVHLSRIDSANEAIKDIVGSVFDDTKVPKKFIKRIAKVRHKNSFSEVAIEDNEFQSLYSVVVKSEQ